MDLNFVIFPKPKSFYTHESMFGKLIYVPHDYRQWALTNPYVSSKSIDKILHHRKELSTHGAYKGKCIPCLYLPSPIPSSKVLLYFHGNAEDVSLTQELMYTVQKALKVHMFVMEYEGYGIYQGNTTAEGIMRDCELLFHYVRNVLNYRPEDIIAFGRSIGSGPASHLAAKYKLNSLILMSAFTSLRAVAKGLVGSLLQYALAERFPNKELMKKVQCPVFLVHGEQDGIVPYTQAEELYEELKKAGTDAVLYIPEEMDHNSFDFELDFVNPLNDFYIERHINLGPEDGKSGLIILPIKAFNQPNKK